MPVSVGAVMRHVNNYFESGYRATTYSIEEGKLSPSSIFAPGMYVAISGSFYHDGVWRLGEELTLEGHREGVPNETFFGRVWFLHPPAEFMDVCEEIAKFAENTPVSGVQSESFGEYSVTHKSGKNGGVLGWQEAFADRLRPFVSMYSEVF
jgi:hypothetical protein